MILFHIQKLSVGDGTGLVKRLNVEQSIRTAFLSEKKKMLNVVH